MKDQLIAKRRLLDRFLAIGAPDAASVFAGSVRAAQIAAVRRYTPWMMAANIASALLIVYSFNGSAYFPHVMIWASVVVAIATFALMRNLAGRTFQARSTASVRGIRRTVAHAFILGIVWAVLPAFFAVGDMEQRIIIGAVVAGMLCGSGFALATVTPAAIAFAGMIAMGSSVALILVPGFTTAALFLLNTVYIAVVANSSLALAKTLKERIEAQIRSEEQRDYIGLLLSDFEEHGNDWLWMIDARGRIQHVSSQLTTLLHRSEEDLVGRSALDCLPLTSRSERSEDERRQLAVIVAAIRSQKMFRDLELTVFMDGWPQRWSLTGKPVFDAEGHFAGYRGIGRNVTAAGEARRRVEHLAQFDVLTGLSNRATLTGELERGFHRLHRKGGDLSLLLIDLDHFKTINDTQGHPVGDELLVEVADKLRTLAVEADLVARLGGDEFAIVMSGDAEAERTMRFAARIVEALSVPISLPSGINALTGASIGIATAKAGSDPATLIRHADLALYRAKQEGRSRFAFFEPTLEAAAMRRHKLERDLRIGLDTQEIKLAYQPLVEAGSLRITACEALARWHHPTFGHISPAEFIAIAEESGLIDRLGAFVLHTACCTAASWPDHVRIAVNLSPVQFRSPGLFAAVKKALEVSGIAPGRLELEITETLFLEQGGHVDATLEALRLLGVRIALDDFGVGYSSLSYLRRYRFDKLKIDRSFVLGLAEGPESAAIIAAIVAMSCELAITVTAEGVETVEQLDSLRSLGCNQIQGYFVGRPVVADEIARKFVSSVAHAA
ncbi:MAG: putative bifunctional diguanylate cyclase/phosphodiesterase [Beijerinckiaceae bacterium]